MVDVLGHLGMALLWLAPVWHFINHRRTAALVAGGGFWFGTLPDIDLQLSALEGIHHHGVFHTVLAVAVFAAVLGPLVGLVFKSIGTRTDPTWFYDAARERAVAIGVITVFVTGISHLFADMLSAPDVSTRIKPLWPVVKGPVVMMDVLWYQSWWATWGLFVLGVTANGLAWYLTDDRDESTAGTAAE